MVKCTEKSHKSPNKVNSIFDDMDGLRKVPDNVPKQDLLDQFINQPLTNIPDPFETHKALGTTIMQC